MKTADKPEVSETLSLDRHGITGHGALHRNLSAPELYEKAVLNGEGRIADGGALAVFTGKHTGRSPNDRFFVREPGSEDKIWWSPGNRPMEAAKFQGLLSRLSDYLKGKELFVQDCYVGADAASRLPVRIITETAWHSLFARNLFISPAPGELKSHSPQFTVIDVPSFKSDPARDGTPSDTCIAIDFASRTVLILNTAYAGEIKKSIFTVMNYLLPLKRILTMHCSANIGKSDDAALFFGLSGTGKTSLSADPARGLIGDDEHGWNSDGVFNFEGGCYAKVINLSAEAEPQIYACTRRFGTVLENVAYNGQTRVLDLDDASITQNTRAGYPLEFIDNAVPGKKGPHPKNIVMLTCDAFGVLPPIARLNVEQAMYHFISGYTAKVAGTEIGLKEPQATFSACFGAPFMAHHPFLYANLLKEKMLEHKTRCWLVNTGWTGGPYGIGKRISIKNTRALLNAALDGRLDAVRYGKDPVFGFEVPLSCEGVDSKLLNPASTWPESGGYMSKYRELAGLFIKNFAAFRTGCSKEVADAGPVVG